MEKVREIGRFQLKLSIPLAVILLALGLAAIVVFQVVPACRGVLIFGSAVLGGLAGLYSAFYIGKSLRIQLERETIGQSFHLLELEETMELNRVRTFIEEELYRKEVPASQMYEMISKNIPLHNAVVTVLNQFETLSVATQNGFVDEPTLVRSVGWRVPFFFKTLEPYVRELRKVLADGEMFIETEKLVRAWDANKYLYSGADISK